MGDDEGMRLAVLKAQEGIAAGQTPFGAAILRGGDLLAWAHNTVRRDLDPTAHAEMNALRQACRAVRDVHLDGCTLYATCAPCPMCLAAIHWARLDRVVHGASLADAHEAGFLDLQVDALALLTPAASKQVVVVAGRLRADCQALFREWRGKRP